MGFSRSSLTFSCLFGSVFVGFVPTCWSGWREGGRNRGDDEDVPERQAKCTNRCANFTEMRWHMTPNEMDDALMGDRRCRYYSTVESWHAKYKTFLQKGLSKVSHIIYVTCLMCKRNQHVKFFVQETWFLRSITQDRLVIQNDMEENKDRDNGGVKGVRRHRGDNGSCTTRGPWELFSSDTHQTLRTRGPDQLISSVVVFPLCVRSGLLMGPIEESQDLHDKDHLWPAKKEQIVNPQTACVCCICVTIVSAEFECIYFFCIFQGLLKCFRSCSSQRCSAPPPQFVSHFCVTLGLSVLKRDSEWAAFFKVTTRRQKERHRERKGVGEQDQEMTESEAEVCFYWTAAGSNKCSLNFTGENSPTKILTESQSEEKRKEENSNLGLTFKKKNKWGFPFT